MNESEQAQEKALKDAYALAAARMKSGSSPRKIEAMLVAKGLDRVSAAAIVTDLARIRSEAVRKAGKKNMLYGGLWCVGGLAVTVATYAAASGGGTYVVAWGAIAIGAIQFLRGLVQISTG